MSKRKGASGGRMDMSNFTWQGMTGSADDGEGEGTDKSETRP